MTKLHLTVVKEDKIIKLYIFINRYDRPKKDPIDLLGD
jgi:hypothetical protein